MDKIKIISTGPQLCPTTGESLKKKHKSDGCYTRALSHTCAHARLLVSPLLVKDYVCGKATLRAPTEMFNVRRSIYWGQEKATFWKIEDRDMFGLIFMNDFMLWAKEKQKTIRAHQITATKEIRGGDIKNEGHGQRCVTER